MSKKLALSFPNTSVRSNRVPKRGRKVGLSPLFIGRTGFVFAVGLLFTVALLLPSPVNAANRTVGTGTAASCSDTALRNAVATAVNDDVITFNCGASQVTINLIAGELVLTKNLTFDGGSATKITISGNNASRIFNISAGLSVTIRNLTISNGRVTNANGGAVLNAGIVTIDSSIFSDNQVSANTTDVSGGAIQNSGTLFVVNSTFSNNQAITANTIAAGGAIYSNGQLTIQNSNFTGNSSKSTSGFATAGAVQITNNVVSLTNSSLIGNSAISSSNWAIGGAFYNENGTAFIDKSTFNGNTAVTSTYGVGGAIVNGGSKGTAQVTNSIVTGNSASGNGSTTAGYGGGIEIFEGDVTVNNSNISNNVVDNLAGGFCTGGGINNGGTLTLNNSTISGNRTGANCYGFGGGITSFTRLKVTDSQGSTFSNNTAATRGGAVWIGYDGTAQLEYVSILGNTAPYGGGISAYGSLTLNRSTLANNKASTVGGAIEMRSLAYLTNNTFSANTAPQGGAIGTTIENPATDKLSATLINNTFTANSAVGAGNGSAINNVYSQPVNMTNNIVGSNSGAANCNGAFFDNGNNLDFGSSCGFSAAKNSLNNSDPKLAPLANNGGPTLTHALLSGSPAIDKGNSFACAASPVSNIDQRGFTRITQGSANVGTACDIGAFELPIFVPAQAPNTVNFVGTQPHDSPINNTYQGLAFDPCFQFWDWTRNETKPLLSAGTGKPGFVVNNARSAVITSPDPVFSCRIALINKPKTAARPKTGDIIETEFNLEVSTPLPIVIEGYDDKGTKVASQNVAPTTSNGTATNVSLKAPNLSTVEIKSTSGTANSDAFRCDLSTNALNRYCIAVNNLKINGQNANTTVTLLPTTSRVAATFGTDAKPRLTANGGNPLNPPNSSSVAIKVGGVGGVPNGAGAITGVLTVVGCTGGGNLRFWTGTTIPDSVALNIPGAFNPVPNLSINFFAPLDTNGVVNLGLSAANGVTCGYAIDVTGFVNSAILLPNSVRLAATVGTNPQPALEITGSNADLPVASSTITIQAGGVSGIPKEAKGLIGVLTVIGCTKGGNLRFWTGSTIPNAVNLNIPGAFNPIPNLSTSFVVPLDANGKVNLGLAGAAGSKCGYAVDVIGFVNDSSLLPSTVRLAATVGNKPNPELVAVGAAPGASGTASTVTIQAGGVSGIPANASGIIGVLTLINCSGGGNLRFWTGSNVPDAVNLNIPGAFRPIPNLSTSFVAPLDSTGKVNLGLGSAAGNKCGYAVDITGYIS